MEILTRIGLNLVHFFEEVDYRPFFNPLSANPLKWSDALKQIVGCRRRIF